jgi:hypothetical protein
MYKQICELRLDDRLMYVHGRPAGSYFKTRGENSCVRVVGLELVFGPLVRVTVVSWSDHRPAPEEPRYTEEFPMMDLCELAAKGSTEGKVHVTWHKPGGFPPGTFKDAETR